MIFIKLNNMEIKSVEIFSGFWWLRVCHRVLMNYIGIHNQTNYKLRFTKRTWRNGGTYHRDDDL